VRGIRRAREDEGMKIIFCSLSRETGRGSRARGGRAWVGRSANPNRGSETTGATD